MDIFQIHSKSGSKNVSTFGIFKARLKLLERAHNYKTCFCSYSELYLFDYFLFANLIILFYFCNKKALQRCNFPNLNCCADTPKIISNRVLLGVLFFNNLEQSCWKICQPRCWHILNVCQINFGIVDSILQI